MSNEEPRRLVGERLVALASTLTVVAGLAAAPLVLWHRVLSDTLSAFHWTVGYLAVDLGPWFLLAASTGCLLPVALSTGLHPESRFYPRSRRVYFIWGVVLYLLGIVLVIQVYDLWNYAH